MGLDVDLGFLNRRQVSQNRKPESPMHIATATVVSWWIVECQDARVARNPDIQSRISREAGLSKIADWRLPLVCSSWFFLLWRSVVYCLFSFGEAGFTRDPEGQSQQSHKAGLP